MFLMADDWSWPHAGAYGEPVVKTPTFDRVAREGVLFSNAHASAPSCTPSRMSIASGQWHWRLKDAANLGGSLPKGIPVYPELLQEAGYEIGFARKGAGPSKHQHTGRDPFGARFKNFREFLDSRNGDKPFCFWYGAGEPHRPYRFGEAEKAGMDLDSINLPACLPDHHTTRKDFADYLHRIQLYDRYCAGMISLLEKRGELDNTIVVMSGDNGMPFPRCKATLYDTGTHVPLAIRWPTAIPGGRIVEDYVSLTDLAPTFLDAAGLAPPSDMTGSSLMPVLSAKKSGQVDPSRTHVLVGMERHVYPQPARAIRTAKYLYIQNVDLDRWPSFEKAAPLPDIDYAGGEWLADGKGFPLNIDQSPTLRYLFDDRDDPSVRPHFIRVTAQRPKEELYRLETDPEERENLAEDPKFAEAKAILRMKLETRLRESGDPRIAKEAPPVRETATP